MESLIGFKILMNSLMIGSAGLLTYLGLDKEVFTIFGWLLLIDYVSGVIKAKRIGEEITSKRMKFGIISKLSLVIIPIVLALAAKALHGDAGTILYVGLNILVLSELYSIIGNIYTINNPNKEELPEWDAVQAIGTKIRVVLIRMSGEKCDDDK